MLLIFREQTGINSLSHCTVSLQTDGTVPARGEGEKKVTHIHLD